MSASIDAALGAVHLRCPGFEASRGGSAADEDAACVHCSARFGEHAQPPQPAPAAPAEQPEVAAPEQPCPRFEQPLDSLVWKGLRCQACGVRYADHPNNEIQSARIETWKPNPEDADFRVCPVSQDPGFLDLELYAHVPGAGAGSVGVFVLQSASAGISVVKSCDGSEYFALKLGEHLSRLHEVAPQPAPAWKVPGARPLTPEQAENLMAGLHLLEPRRNLASKGYAFRDLSWINRLASSYQLLRMEFIPGHSLLATDVSGVPDQVLRDLGGMMVFDLLINNWDRIGVADLWDTEGNPDNFIVTSAASAAAPDERGAADAGASQQQQQQQQQRLGLIDQHVTAVTEPELRQHYLEHARLLVQRTLDRQPGSAGEAVSDFFRQQTGGGGLSPAQVETVNQGFETEARLLVGSLDADPEESPGVKAIVGAFAEARAEPLGYPGLELPEDPNAASLADLRDFCAEVLRASIRAALAGHPAAGGRQCPVPGDDSNAGSCPEQENRQQ